jgi:hypothetical protein
VKYNYQILDKPYKENIESFYNNKITCEAPQTAKVTFLNGDGSIKKVVEYGYRSPEEILIAIDNQESLNLDGYFVKDISFKDHELQYVQAFSSFFHENVDFEGTTFHGNAEFSGAIFGGNANFRKAKFNSDANFQYVTFSGDTDFWYAFFSSSGNFRNAILNSDATFTKATFSGNANFLEATFSGDNDFWGVTFSSNAVFSGATYRGKTDFRKATYNDSADFQKATYSGDANFWNATFSGIANFWNATFNGVANFLETTFSSKADFEGITFRGNAYFVAATFSSEVDFMDATFIGEADFKDAIVNNTIQFLAAKFLSYAKFNFLKCKVLVIDDCIFEKLCTVSSGSGFISLAILNCKTTAPFSLPFDDNLKQAILHQTDANTNNIDFNALAQQFNFLKVCYNHNGEYNFEDHAYVEYRRCFRKTKNRFVRALEWFFLDLISCYCTKPFHVFYAALVAIAFFAGLYNIPGAVDFTGHYQGFWGSIYHSVITFFTIGYGDSSPMGWLGLPLTGLEGFIGVFLMSLFTVSFVRKVLR